RFKVNYLVYFQNVLFLGELTFTLAHSCTLILSSLQVFKPTPGIIEPLIALSILYVALENIFTPKNRASRSVIIFLLGLLHGLGFAGVLSEIGIPSNHFYKALIAFNIGVEIGQITVILLAYFLITKWFYQKEYYRRRFIIPISATIAVIAAYLTIERIL
ncbi:MAG: HupE/UreJ family protein, partial [Chitinophagaceae bacterium]|nr:HupE/UreJ family protein [Chitinophagaceae bacterium]